MAGAELRWNGSLVEARIFVASVEGIKDAAEHLLAVSRSRVPLEEGTLERSGAVTVDEADVRAVVSYDGPYAVRQHEELSWQHDPGRTAKYLEGPAMEERDTMRDLIAARIRRAVD